MGGTFTDIVAWDGEHLTTGKVPTTPDQADGVIDVFSRRGGGRLFHGTTAATNAALQRSGAKIVLVSDAGFEDLVEIARQDRPSLYDLEAVRALPLASREARLGVPGRAFVAGGGEPPADPGLAARVAALGPEAIAIALLYSYLHPQRERAVAEVLRQAVPGVPISLSSEVIPEFREYERASTTALNAFLTPVVSDYLQGLVARLGDGPEPVIMRSSGGLMAMDDAARLPAAVLLSGPAGGVVAAGALGDALGRSRVISFDMGGTSTDVCRIENGRPEIVYERAVGGLPCRMPSVAIHTVGAGGGSIGWQDAGGALRVGPQSAGSTPGPASYGRGGEAATVTDADLVLGRIGGGRLGGTLQLDRDLAAAALTILGEGVGLSAEETALGMVTVVEAHMERAVRMVSVEEGVDPRSAALVAFGGAGGLHATALARSLEMEGVVVPAHAGVFSALGLLLAPSRVDASRSIGADAEIASSLDEVMEEALAGLGGAGSVSAFADVRYLGQSHETTVPVAPGEPLAAVEERFHLEHRRRNGFARPDDPVEMVTVRAEATGAPAVTWDRLPAPDPHGEPSRPGRDVLTPTGSVEAAVWWRPSLPPGSEIVGPAVIEEPEATTYLALGERAVVHDSGALEVDW